VKVVLLNGPARSGKDTVGNALHRALGAEVVKFAAALKDATHAMFGLEDVATEAFDAVKDEPRSEFHGYSPRQAYIRTSEHMVKPVWGDMHFGHVLARKLVRLRSQGVQLAAVTDSGFRDEVIPVVAALGASNVSLVRLHRPGRTFAGDSRGYLTLDHLYSVDLQNDGTEDDLAFRAVDIVHEWANVR
jgi:hypothetical protein